MTLPPRILILYAHPANQRSRVNRRLCEAAQTLSNVQVHDLYDNYPDFYIDVNREQELVASCDLLIFQHPIQWFGMPSLLKEWVDTVLEQGWAYGPEGNALRGKDFWLVATAGGPEMSLSATGGPEQALSAFLPPFERTAQCCGMHWISPLVVHGARDADDDLIDSYAEDYRRRLASYPAWVTDEAARRHEFIASQK